MSGAVTDPIADFLTRLRNACQASHEQVSVPASRLKLELARVLRSEGYIQKYDLVEDSKQGVLRITLKYTPEGLPAIQGLERVSKPGRRVYVDRESIPWVVGGLGVAILSTSRNVMTD